MMDSFVMKADFCWSISPETVDTLKNGWLVCMEGKSAGIFRELPQVYIDLPVADYSSKLVIPGLVDLHVHAPQYISRGLGLDRGVNDQRTPYVFDDENKYGDDNAAYIAYRRFVGDMLRGPNTRACIFATRHTDATLTLMDLLEESGLCTMVGKVNMDRGGPEELWEESTEASMAETLRWLEELDGCYQNTRPILTPGSIMTCSEKLLHEIRCLQVERELSVQSHLSEHIEDSAYVQRCCPESRFYGDAFERHGLLGGEHCPAIMAHCVYSGPAEIRLLKERGTFVAHCPTSNMNLAAGIAPIRVMLDEGVRVGLGSDIAGGTELSIFRAMADAIRVSKLRWRLINRDQAPLTLAEAFYMGTLGGGRFFGKVGSFEPGFELDAIVLDDTRYTPADSCDLLERLARTVYCSDDRDVIHKYVRGRCLY